MKLSRTTYWLIGLALAGCLAVSIAPAADPSSAGSTPAVTPTPAAAPIDPNATLNNLQAASRPDIKPAVNVMRPAPPLTDEERTLVMDFFKSEQPDLHESLAKAKDTDPERYNQMIEKAGRPALYWRR